MANRLCTTCGYVGQTKRVTKGSFFIELILWLAFLVPGLIYSVWRLTTRYDACPKCGSANMIPLNSPIAKKMLQESQPQPQPAQYVQQHVPPPPLPVEQRYRIAQNGQDVGELPASTIRQMLRSGQLTPQDYYFDFVSNDWVSLESLFDVSAL